MWRGFFEHFGKCGRDATLFIVAFLILPTALATMPALGPLTVPVLVGLTLFAAARLVLAWKHAARGFEKLGRLPPLSEQDRRRARARLLRTAVPRKACATQRIELPPTGKALALH